jgi:V8-like Glu-specific endopeptidase
MQQNGVNQMKRLFSHVFCVVALSLSAPALAVDWDDYELGEFYKVSDVEDDTIKEASQAVVYFKGATGFIISSDGYILTNHHVWDGFGDTGKVYRHKTEKGYAEALSVTLITKSEKYDMALYKTDATDLPFVPLRSTPAKVGEEVFVIGHPDSKPLRVSFGKILAKDITISKRPSIEYSAQTWWGSSGSPVLDKSGAVVALHWGWDSEGLSNGRLTGVPITKMAKAIPEINALLTGEEVEAPTKVSCKDASLFSIETEMLKVESRRTKKYVYHDLRVTTKVSNKACAKEVASVIYTLHPSFSHPTRKGDASQKGFPLSITAWGMFPVKAEVTLRDGSVFDFDGYVSW